MESHFSRVASSVLLACILVFAASLAAGQGIVTGSVSGAVQDPQGALISGAAVTATHVDTNRQFHAATNEAGQFLMRQLPSGRYNVVITATGFQTLEVKDLQVAVGQDSSLGTVKVQLG